MLGRHYGTWWSLPGSPFTMGQRSNACIWVHRARGGTTASHDRASSGWLRHAANTFSVVEIVKIQRSVALWKRNVRLQFFQSWYQCALFYALAVLAPKWPLVIVQCMAVMRHRSSGAFRNWHSLRVILLRDVHVGLSYLLWHRAEREPEYKTNCWQSCLCSLVTESVHW